MGYRTHNCGQLTAKNDGEEIILSGWVNKVRNFGGMTFIDLRDRYGITQVTYDPSQNTCELPEIKSEYVLKIHAKVKKRPENMINKEMVTGEIELFPTQIEVLSSCKELPFPVDHEAPVGEDIRLEYRYLDLRRQTMKENIIARHKVFTETIKFFDQEQFLHIETPSFVKNTPEGSREFIVPARFEPGKFFVLPQSPQQQKQMLMVAGVDKYVQIARCFRDEDPRGDRQPEFTQIDFEMSFIEQQEILELIQKYFITLSKTVFPHKQIAQNPFPIYTREDAMNTYGSDKPELRTKEFSFEDFTDWSKTTSFSIFHQANVVKAIFVPKALSRSEVDKYETFLKQYGAKGLSRLSQTSEGLKGTLAKFVTPEAESNLPKRESGEWTLLFQAGERDDVVKYLGMLRTKLIQDFDALKGKENEVNFAFVVDFPLFEVGSDGGLGAVHHPFTKPKDADIPFVKQLGKKLSEGGVMTEDEKKQLLSIKADCYDIIFNGSEAGGGSIRIYDKDLQSAIFSLLGLKNEQIQARFGHLLKCFEYGVPPHGGCAFGLDRVVMLYQNMETIREVIAFPKNQKYRDLMIDAPNEIDSQLLSDLGLSLLPKK